MAVAASLTQAWMGSIIFILEKAVVHEKHKKHKNIQSDNKL
ncbi:hypothetical protein SFMTTN_1802 [Sulfuriferula multivorans]|uniref:Uncharacterized protein n=1 Tax=Sulfuriferula multivorans TaxID=1559896 RepID=A0A401JEE1_9PROT|nr:hypothetical protein SFMTTN_1802 [Sulfuriferula multivorans]